MQACEAVDRLPEIEVTVYAIFTFSFVAMCLQNQTEFLSMLDRREEYSAREFEKLQGIGEHKLKDKALYKNTVLDRAEVSCRLGETTQFKWIRFHFHNAVS